MLIRCLNQYQGGNKQISQIGYCCTWIGKVCTSSAD